MNIFKQHKNIFKSPLLVVLFFFSSLFSFAQVGIGTITPDASSALEVASTTQGFLAPRMTTAERDAIANPAKGLIIYNLDEDCLQFNLGTTSSPNWACFGSPSSFLTNNCDANGFEGAYSHVVAFDASNDFTVTVTNTSFSSTTIALTPADVVLSGTATGFGTLSVSSVSPTSVVLAAGQSQVVSYQLSGTPATGTLQADWTKATMSCTKTRTIGTGDAVFTLPIKAAVGSFSNGVPLLDHQGVIDNATNQVVVHVPYTSGSGSYDAYTSAVVTNAAGTGEASDANGFSISYPAGTFSARYDLNNIVKVWYHQQK